jgi:nitrogen regulatory protein PII-like uncharacterized protein
MESREKEESTERQVAEILRELHDKAVLLNTVYDRDEVRDVAERFSRKYADLRSSTKD